MEPLVTIDQAACYLGVKRHVLTSPRARERAGIPTLKLVASVRFRRADLDAWLAHRSNPDDACLTAPDVARIRGPRPRMRARQY